MVQHRRLRRLASHIVAPAQPRITADTSSSPSDTSAPRPAWQAAAREKALALPNRGPIELTDEGRLAPHILRTLEDVGFYVFTGVVAQEELADLRADLTHVLGRSASHTSGAVSPGQAAGANGSLSGSGIDARLSAAPDEWFAMAPPLSDPDGGRGRSPAKMAEGVVPSEAPPLVMRSASRFHEYSEAGIRLYGHPGLLAVGASICGEDFAPDGGGESIQIKLPGLGPSVAWHQDGTTHWSDDGTTQDHCSHGAHSYLTLLRS
jgi:hypothetical protein